MMYLIQVSTAIIPNWRRWRLQGMDDTGNVTKNGQEDVDEEVCIAATLKEDT